MGAKRTSLTALALLAGIGIVAGTFIAGSRGTGGPAAAEEPPQRSISVSGYGEVLLRPDLAVLNIGVSVLGESVEEARARAAGSMADIIDSLKANGLDEKDLQTTSISIQPEYDYTDGKATLRGYRVQNTVSAKVRDLDAAGRVIDDAVAAGGDDVILGGISFTVEDTTGATSQARELAMKDARGKAEQLASLGGVSLGDPLQISESGGAAPPPRWFDGGAAPGRDEKTEILPGQLSVSISVSVVYSFE